MVSESCFDRGSTSVTADINPATIKSMKGADMMQIVHRFESELQCLRQRQAHIC